MRIYVLVRIFLKTSVCICMFIINMHPLKNNLHPTSETQHFVDNGADVTGKKLSHVKYSSKRSDFSDFLLIFAMSLMILLVLICSTKVSEISDMAKS